VDHLGKKADQRAFCVHPTRAVCGKLRARDFFLLPKAEFTEMEILRVIKAAVSGECRVLAAHSAPSALSLPLACLPFGSGGLRVRCHLLKLIEVM